MKNLSIILVCLLVAMISCTKSKEVHPEIGDGNDEIVTVGIKDVHVEYTRTDHAELNRVVFYYCPADTDGNAQQFMAAEMTKKETFFELVLDDLICDTLFWYYYELFPNSGDAFTTAQKTFHTQFYEDPYPTGSVNGLFSVSPTQKVYFSQGNLQYQASTNTWRFAEHQWEYVGGIDELFGTEYGNVFVNGVKCDNSLRSETYQGWIDLFGFGTNGVDNGFACYQPWSTSINSEDYYCYNLYEESGIADWGYNAISNGGNQIGLWRTLKYDEWSYLLRSRYTVSGIRYALACLDGTNGIVFVPDDWESSYYDLNNYNGANFTDGTFYTNNIISIEEWNSLIEPHGAVFLPATGTLFQNRYDNYINNQEEPHGNYSTAIVSVYFCFHNNYIGDGWTTRAMGAPVRLVQDVQ